MKCRIICQKECLDFADILNTKKILLVKLPHGLVGIENSHLLGTTIVSKVFQAALLRQGQQQRSDFYFYIDEFQNYLTESIANILAEGRKFNLSLVLAHQSLSQITNDQIAESIFANAAIRVCFRLGQKDATKLAESFSTFTASDFQNLATGEAIVKVGQSNFDFSLKTCSLKNVKNNEKSIKELVETSRAKYCKSKSLVEEDLSQSLNNIPVNSKEDVEIISSPLISNEHGIKKQSASILPTNTKLNSHNVPLKSNIDSDHRFLQNRIKQVASVYGYKSTIEAATSDGKGRVDVLLEKDDITIAVEISIATDITWEIHNIKKCLENSYSKIISCHTDTKSILAMKNRIKETFKTEELAKIQVLSPENVYQYLGTTLKENGQPKTIKGYEVNVEYNNNEGGKRQSIAKILLATSKEKK